MTNPDYTALLFIIDESGSMQSIAKDMEGGIATILEEQSKLPGKLTVDVAYFDSGFRYPQSLVAAADANIKIVPNSATALHDAIVRASAQFGATLEDMPEEERPGTVLAIIVTDGQENSSRESSTADVKEVITRQQDTYNWNFIFLGANQDAILTGGSLGLRQGASLTYNATRGGVFAAATSTSTYIGNIRSGNTADFNDIATTTTKA